MILNKNKGFSLAELMIAVGMVGGLSYLAMHITKNQTTSTTKVFFETELILTFNEMYSLLSNNDNCVRTFSNTDTPSGISNFNKTLSTVTPKYIKQSGSYLGENAPAAGYGAAGLQIDSYSLAPMAIAGSFAETEEILTVKFINKNILKSTPSTPNTVTKTIPLIVLRNESGNVKACRTVAASRFEPWQHISNSYNINYQGGSVGINIIPPTYPDNPLLPGTLINLDIAGTIFAHVARASDKRLKTNILPLKNSLKKTLSIRGVSFDWKKSGKHDVGVIAQEIEKEMPELILHNPSNNTLSVDYINIIPFLIESIKTQQKEINDLNKQLDRLE